MLSNRLGAPLGPDLRPVGARDASKDQRLQLVEHRGVLEALPMQPQLAQGAVLIAPLLELVVKEVPGIHLAPLQAFQVGHRVAQLLSQEALRAVKHCKTE